MVDAGENLSVTLKREFGEEALNTLEVHDSQRDTIKDQIDKIFTKGNEVCTTLITYLGIACNPFDPLFNRIISTHEECLLIVSPHF